MTQDTHTHTFEAPSAAQQQFPPNTAPRRAADQSPQAEPAPSGAPPGGEPASGEDKTRNLPKLLAGLVHSVPTVLVLTALAGLGYWGHHTGWKIPKFSELTGNVAPPGPPWCNDHGVPKEICIACNPDLMPKDELQGWCREHGVAECVLHHPELAQLKETPEISASDLERARRALEMRERPKNDPLCNLHLRRIQFASAEAAEKAGVDIGLVSRGRIVETVSATGEIRYDPTRVARLSSRAPGTVWRVEKNIGDPVRQGEVVALVDAAQVGQAKAELLQAAAKLDLQRKTYKRLLSSEGAVAGRLLQESEAAQAEAQAAVRKAVQTLNNLGLDVDFDQVREQTVDRLSAQLPLLGLPSDVVSELEASPVSSNLIPITAPREGLVVERDVVAGEVIDASRTLFTVADTSLMWVLLDIPLEEARHLNVGQKVTFRPDGADHDHDGHITWMSTEVDPKTRTVKVRAELPNSNGHLRNETFGVGKVVLREEIDAIVAPKKAIHWEGCCHVAFVRDKDFLKEDSYKVYHARSVRPGVANGDTIEMIAGLLPGEVVATEGSGVLRAELLKGNLGAG